MWLCYRNHLLNYYESNYKQHININCDLHFKCALKTVHILIWGVRMKTYNSMSKHHNYGPARETILNLDCFWCHYLSKCSSNSNAIKPLWMVLTTTLSSPNQPLSWLLNPSNFKVSLLLLPGFLMGALLTLYKGNRKIISKIYIA